MNFYKHKSNEEPDIYGYSVTIDDELLDFIDFNFECSPELMEAYYSVERYESTTIDENIQRKLLSFYVELINSGILEYYNDEDAIRSIEKLISLLSEAINSNCKIYILGD